MQNSTSTRLIFQFFILAATLASCRSIEIVNKKNAGLSSAGGISPIKRKQYALLNETTGKAASTQIYLLFFPIGRSANHDELASNAYYKAVKNCPGADAVILPRVKTSKFFIPLLLINYRRNTVVINGRGISVKPDSVITHQ